MSVPSTTLAQFRIDAAIELRDGLVLTATDDGDTGTFFDTANLTDGPDQYRDSHAIVITASNASNVGRVVTVDSSSPEGSLTFTRALPAATTIGDVVHLVNLGGYGFRPQMYDQAIAAAIRASFPDYVEEAVSSSVTAFDVDSPTIAVPATFAAVFAVEGLDDADAGDWRSVPKARGSGLWAHGWSLDRANRAVRIDGCWRDELDGLDYRVRGYTPHAVPASDSDPITLDLVWLMLATKAALAARRGTDRAWQQWAVEWGRQAQEQRLRILTPRMPNTEWL